MNKLNRYYISQNISIDNALSMNQILHQIVNEIKDIVEFINDLELRANEYTDEQIRLLNERLQAQLETLENTLKTYTNDKIDEYNAEIINPQLIEIRNTIDNVNQLLNNRIDREVGILNRKIDSVESSLIVMINDTKEYLEELIRKGNQLIFSGISGKKIPIQDALKEIANACKQMLSYNWNTLNILKYASDEIISGSDVVRLQDASFTNYTNIYIKTHIGQASSVYPALNYKNYEPTEVECVYADLSGNVTQILFNGVNAYDIEDILITQWSMFIPITLLKYCNDIKIYFNDTLLLHYTVMDYDKNPSYISWQTLKSQMQNEDIEIKPNWNGLVYDGVNGWNILSSVVGLYNDMYISPLWNELPYKNNVYRNENSNFYNQIEVEGD